MGDRIINYAYILAKRLQTQHPNWDWLVCCQTAIDTVRLANAGQTIR